MVQPNNTTATKLDPALKAASEKFRNDFLDALNLSPNEEANLGVHKVLDFFGVPGHSESDIARELIGNREPAELMDAFAKARPEWAGVMNQIKADPVLAKSFHNVLEKDPTMLPGFATMFTEIGENASPAKFSAMLDSERVRRGLAKALDKIAEKDDLTFKDFRELYDKRDDQGALVRKLGQMDINMSQMMDTQGILKLVTDFFRDPAGFLSKLPDMLQSMGVMGPIQADAWKTNPVYNFAKNYAGVALGGLSDGTPGYGEYIADGIQWGQKYYESGKMKRDIDALSGEADRVANETTKQAALHAGQGTAVPPGQGIDVTVNKSGALNGDFSKVAANNPFQASPEIRAEIDKFDKEQVATRTQPQASPGMMP